jgi:eukaryotic-like serine/threonine-protein kinase
MDEDASTDDAPSEVLEPGRVIGRNFRIDKLLGQGAMGQVYLAEQLSLSKQVAIKVLHKHLANDPALAKRFHREAKSASQLNHPNSIQIIDFGADESGALFIAMELLDGRDLGKIIRAEFPLPLARIVRIMGQVFAALDEAHVKGVIHRDLKPENVMVMDRRGEPDTVKVCDFGIAKIQDPKSDSPESVVTMAGIVCGTPEYMSPEQARGEKLDGRTDLYSAACILYQMATGELPFTAESALGVVTKHLSDAPIPPRQRRPDLEIDPGFEALILRGLAKDRARRPASALAFKRELEQVLAQAGSAGSRVPTTRSDAVRALGTAATVAALQSGQLPQAPPRGGATKIAIITIIGVLAVVGIAAVLLLNRAPPPTGPRATDPVAAAPAPDASAPAPATQPAGPASARADAVAPTGALNRPLPLAHKAGLEPKPDKGKPDKPKPDKKIDKDKPPTDKATADRPEKDKPDVKAAAVRGLKEVLTEAEEALKAGQGKDAIRLFEEARRKSPGHPRAHRALGKLYTEKGRIGEAKQAYEKYLELQPKASDAPIVRGILDRLKK